MDFFDSYKGRLVVFVVLLSAFLFLLFMLVVSFLSMHSSTYHLPAFLELFVVFHVHFMVLLGFLGIGLGVCSYYVFSAHAKSLQDSQVLSKDLLFRFLDADERRVLEELSRREVVTQADVSRMNDMGKVRAYRTVKKLVEQGVITTEPHGRTKRLLLDEELRGVF